MIEIALVSYAVLYVLWLLALVCTGESRRFLVVTAIFLFFPFVLFLFVTIGTIVFTLGMVMCPIMAITCESYKEKFKSIFVEKGVDNE